MNEPALTTADLSLLGSRGITPQEVAAQLRRLRNPAPPIALDRACTIGDGIVRVDEPAASRFLQAADEAILQGRVTKFVPASGAATRMFKELIAGLAAPGRPSELSAAREFFHRLDEFPFARELRARSGIAGMPSTEAEERTLLRVLLEDMQFGELPKGLIPFHRSDRVRTAFEEHLLEGTGYTCGGDGTCGMHFTVPPAFHADFETALATARKGVHAARPDTRLAVTFSEQQPSTDTVAIDAHGELFRNPDGTLLFRPSGHGALLGNLAALGGDLVVIKNIDNIVPYEASAEIIRWKRILIGALVELQRSAFAYMRALAGDPSSDEIEAALAFVEQTFARTPAAGLQAAAERRRFAMEALDRPLRVCGVVRNEGEPGGSPLWVRSAGQCTVQIVEPSQVDTRDPQQAAILRGATHFNPVDIVCGLRSWLGAPFDLERFVDQDTAFVVKKSADGRELIALERPGLWNGSMAGWNTVCVEVPASTFAPVKTVFDLLRPEHQTRAREETEGAEATDITRRNGGTEIKRSSKA